MTRQVSNMTRSITPLSPRLDQRLLAYASAATAAGVGLLASSQLAEAKIVYTAANVTIPANSTVTLDLNNDGVADFTFYNSSYFGSARRKPLGLYRDELRITPSNTANEVWAVESQSVECAAALPSGVKVGPGAAFQPGGFMWEVAGDYTNQFSARCQWNHRTHGAFLGLKFMVNGETHYGWAHVTVGSTTVLNGYAYETVPNQAIATGKSSGPVAELDVPTSPGPKPATLGMLAQGSRGLSIWRREDGKCKA
jgi:hypothetical protein